jgi:hypothetical protein
MITGVLKSGVISFEQGKLGLPLPLCIPLLLQYRAGGGKSLAEVRTAVIIAASNQPLH